MTSNPNLGSAASRIDTSESSRICELQRPSKTAQVEPREFKKLFKMGGGGKIPYPKHVWSPAGGWYSQPSNWKANTAVMGVVIIGITAMMWKVSADRETRTRFPEEGRFFPSRYWSKQIIEHEKVEKAKKAGGS